MTEWNEELIGERLRMLRPPPDGWVAAASELPFLAEWVGEIEARAERDEEFRRALSADLEAALRAADYEPTPELLKVLRGRL